MPRLPPSVPGWPVLGVLPRFARDPMRAMEAVRDHGPLVRAAIGGRDFVFVNEPALVAEVLMARVDDFVKEGLQKERLEPMVGDGLPFIDGGTWHRARRMMNPMFAKRRLEALCGAMTSTINEHLELLETHARNGEPIDLSAELAKVTMNVLTTTMFGYGLSETERHQLGADFRLSNSWLNWRMWTGGLPGWVPIPYGRRGAAALARTERAVKHLVDVARQHPEREDLLTLLVHSRSEDDGSTFSDKEIRDHTMTLLFAGYETTSVTSAWTLAMLEQHPAWEERVAAEIDEVLGEGVPGPADWPRLVVTKACWEEAMRLYPPAFINGRQAARDVELGGFSIPAGTMVVFNVAGIHRDPRHWDRPADYDPDRWLGGRAERVERGAYFPFGLGPHVCIGASMANMEAVLLISMLLQRYRLALVAGASIEPKVRLSVQFKDGPRMRIERRTRRYVTHS